MDRPLARQMLDEEIVLPAQTVIDLARLAHRAEIRGLEQFQLVGEELFELGVEGVELENIVSPRILSWC